VLFELYRKTRDLRRRRNFVQKQFLVIREVLDLQVYHYRSKDCLMCIFAVILDNRDALILQYLKKYLKCSYQQFALLVYLCYLFSCVKHYKSRYNYHFFLYIILS